jgi:hypothetical protein
MGCHLECSKSKVMKYDYNQDIKDVVLVTDDKERTRSKMINFILKLLRNNGLNPITTKHFDGEQLREKKKLYFHRDKKIFKNNIEYLTKPVSIKTLIKFSRQKPEFQKALRKDPLAIMKLLYREYKKRFHQADSLHEIIEHYEIGQKFAARFPDAHVVIVLFFHKVISPKLQNNGTLNYHSVGRGFYGYGGCKPIEPEIGSPGRAKISISAKAVSDFDFEEKKAFTRRVFFHEYWGHAINNLNDHFSIPMKKCIMSAPPSLKSLIQNALDHNELCFCEECLNKINYYPETFTKQ